MHFLFWLCFALVVHTYCGYPVWLWLLSRVKSLPILEDREERTVSIIISARNEESTLPAKLDNLRRMDYPTEKVEIVVVSDGSTDRTAAILREQEWVVPVVLDRSNGKAAALNEAVKHAHGDLLIFQDARQLVEADCVSNLVRCFGDPAVGAVSGELLLESASGEPHSALGIYWKIEKAVRKLESASGSVVGVTGAIYAIRRELFPKIPPGTILDDVYVPMQVARMGKRIVFQPKSIVRDRIFSGAAKEFSRKVRTLTGNYQLLRLAPWLLTPKNPLFFRFISHKLLRLAVPFFLILMLLALAWSSGRIYRGIFWLQIIFYLLGILGMVSSAASRFKPVSFAKTFLMLNAAALLAFYNFIVGRGAASLW
ncbi:MAG TPA: glycosyltransferase family 2 protein [Acidobacteriaceae bacterium]|nr:glycosyltransferase family 2 protein [Acidobacteriaceae bacterium]